MLRCGGRPQSPRVVMLRLSALACVLLSPSPIPGTYTVSFPLCKSDSLKDLILWQKIRKIARGVCRELLRM